MNQDNVNQNGVNANSGFLWCRSRKSRRGQVLVLVAVMMTALLGMAAFTVDFGIIYYSNNELMASTQAATLAGAEAMAQPGATAALVTTAVTTYSGVTGNKNAQANLTGVSVSSTLKCLTTPQTTFGIYCYGPATSAYPNGTNALAVTQTVKVPLTFAGMFGTGSITLSSTATASMKGASSGPFNVVILMDSTSSMNNSQSAPDCSTTAIACALAGAQILLQNLSPCPASQIPCGAATGSPPEVPNSVDRVSLLTFPPVSTLTAQDDYNCGRTTPTIVPYATPFPAASTYQIVNFASDYRVSDVATTLNASSNLVAAVGGKSGCTGLQAIGGDGTYYAQAVYQAQALLAAEKTANPGSNNVLILLSDGDASSTCSTASKTSPYLCLTGPMSGAYTKTITTYPSTIDQCHQAITAAQASWAAGTTVYTVNFGAEASGCSTDSPSISPCQTMLQMATNPTVGTSSTYFSDDPSSGVDPVCIAAARPTTTLNQIFQAIAGDLTVAKLIPNSTT
jgi:Flp pilus assembly protein TadG